MKPGCKASVPSPGSAFQEVVRLGEWGFQRNPGLPFLRSLMTSSDQDSWATLDRMPNIPEPWCPAQLSNDAPYWELFLWVLLTANTARQTPKHIRASLSIGYGVTREYLFTVRRRVDRMALGPSLQKRPAQQEVQGTWGGCERQRCLPWSSYSGFASPHLL